MKKSNLGTERSKVSLANNSKEENKPKQNNWSIVDRIILIAISLGIWGIFLQNLGILMNNELTQKVRVVNTVSTSISGEVDTYVNGGSISVSGEVDTNLQTVNGYSVTTYEGGLLGVYDPYNN